MDAAAADRSELVAELELIQEEWPNAVMPLLMAPLLETDITIQQLRVLALIAADAEGGTGRDLAHTLGVSMATVSGIIDRLESQDMVTRVSDAHDHRVRRIRTTPRGRDLVLRLLAMQPRLDDAVLGRIDVEDLRALARGMRALITALVEAPRAP